MRSWAGGWALVFWIALVGMLSVARADELSGIPLFISDAIPADTAAAQAATRWAMTLPAPLKLNIQSTPAFPDNTVPKTGIVLAPITQWHAQLPALDVLRLPFFYTDLSAVHQAIDGELGVRLAQASQAAGWQLLAIWDAGMTDFSGNQRYNRLPNLAGMKFVLWHPDSLQETELRALGVWSRVVSDNGVQRMAQECLVNSRSTTPAQMWREQLQRVHLDITLTQDRYEGFMLAIPLARWNRLSTEQRTHMTNSLASITSWERTQASHEQTQALEALHKAGMQVHPLDAATRQEYTQRMPPWQHFLVKLDEQTANDLIATARTATAASGLGSTREKAPANPLPAAPSAK